MNQTNNDAASEAFLTTIGLDAGYVTPSTKRYRITWPHSHKTLKTDDVVVMTQSPEYGYLLFRESDMTLHYLQDDIGQFVHMIEVTNG